MQGSTVYFLLQEVTNELDTKIKNLPKAFIPQGSRTFEELPASPSKDNLGYIWNITNEFTTDTRFIEGAGKHITSGNNVGTIMHNDQYYYDVMSMVDLSNYYTKVEVNSLVNEEKVARETADTTLTNALSTESQTRAEADSTLLTNITNEESSRISADNALSESINQEAITRELADTTLQANIDTEKSRATTAESTLDSSIKTESDRAKAVEATKLDVMPGDSYTAGNAYNLPYFFSTNVDANKVTVTAKTVTLDGKATHNEYSLDVNAATTEKAGLMSAADKEALNNKLDVLPLVPEGPGAGWPYHIPYDFDAVPDTEKLNITLKTLTLDNKVTKMNFEKSLPAATALTAGLMSASDKVTLSRKQDKLTAGDNITIENNVISAVVKNNAYANIKLVADYLFETDYVDVDYSYANNYYLTTTENEGISCKGTVVIKDGVVLNQTDAEYSDDVEFIVKRSADDDSNEIYNSSIGISRGIKGLTKSFVESGAYSDKFKLIPFTISEGINDKGLYVQSNIVPKNGIEYNINASGSDRDCCVTMLVRYILDHCETLSHVRGVFETVHIYSNPNFKYGYHFFAAKDNDWMIIELKSTTAEIVRSSTSFPQGVLSNFRTTNVIVSDNEIDYNSVEKYGMGLERFNIAYKAFAAEPVSLINLRNDLKYTNFYTTEENRRYTELTGQESLDEKGHPTGHILEVQDAKTNPSLFDTLYVKEQDKYWDRSRETKEILLTVHSTICNLSNKCFDIAIQERFGDEYKTYLYSLNKNMFNITPTLPDDFNSSTYSLKFINGVATWVKE